MTSRILLGAMVAIAVSSYATSVARACGGFFCSRATPMDQAGEKIVFAVEPDGTTVAHVQIQYQGAASGFAWILPVPSVPEISVGTDELFRTMEAATRPQFRLQYRTEGTCRERPRCPMPSSSWDHASRAGWSDAGAIGLADSGRAGVDVHLREAVGPYDVAVLSSTDSAELMTWLSDNGYDIPEATQPLIDDYIAKNDVFVALKLLSDRAAGEIQPIVLRYRELQPCIPIRLTAIATVPDMPITAWVLADRRAVPYNYMSLLPPVDNPALWTGGASYEREVTRVVDDAGGRAFVTDYAGATPGARVQALRSVEDLRTQTDVKAFARELQYRGFTGDAQLLGILTRHIPPPDWASAQDFYNCLLDDWCSSYDAHLAELVFDPSALVDDLMAQIVTPREQANAMLDAHGTLTRLFTTMSAEDMTEDPVFVLDADMPSVSNVHTAIQVTECSRDYFEEDAPRRLILPSGAERRISPGVRYLGSDDDYCIARTGYTATGERPRTGGLCSASPGGAAPLGITLAVLLGAAVTLRIRRSRR